MSRFVLIQALFWAVAPALLGQSFEAPPEDGPRLGGPQIEDGRLVIPVIWPAEMSASTAVLELLDHDGGVMISSLPVLPEAGAEGFYPLTQDLQFIAGHGYRYRVRLVDVLGQALAPEAAALIGLCPSSEGCVYRMIEGVAAGAVTMGRELFELLEHLEAVGSTDLLRDALGIRPDLDFEVYWVADQIFRRREGGEGGDGDDCQCLWIAAPAPSLKREESDQMGGGSALWEDPDWWERRLTGPRAFLAVAAQMLGGPMRSMMAEADVRVGLHLRCLSTAGWAPISWSGLDLQVPRLDSCERSCPDALIRSSAWGFSGVRANAVASDLHGARGSGSAIVELFVNDELEFTAAADVDVTRSPGEVPALDAPVITDSGVLNVERQVWGRDATLRYSARLEVETCLASGSAADCPEGYLRPVSDDGSWALAQAKVAMWADLVGEASCAQPRSESVSIMRGEGSGSKDGVLISPWRP